MLKRPYLTLIVLLLVSIAINSCSTVRLIPDGSSRLKSNKVKVLNSDSYPSSDIVPYIRQKPNTYFIGHWNPFLYVYNWGNDSDSGWDRFVKKIGQAPVIFDSLSVSSSKDNMVMHLEYMGYYKSFIEDSIVTKKKKTTVHYNVMTGKQYPVKAIDYQIDDAVLDSLYFDDISASLIHPGIILSESILDKESDRATSLFRNNGFYEFNKNYISFEADTLSVKDSAILYMKIANHTRNEVVQSDKHHKQYRIGNISVFPVSDVVRYRASQAYLPQMQLDTIKMDNLNILYDNKLIIKPKTIDYINTIEKGSLYSEEEINNTYNRFTNLRVLSSVNIEMDIADSSTVDCFIRLIPSKFQGYKINIEASSNSTGLLGISPAISYHHRNLFRGGEWFNMSVMGNFQFSVNDDRRLTEFGVSSNLSFPKFLFLPQKFLHSSLPRTDLLASYNFQQRPEYTRNMISTSLGFNWNNRNGFYFQIYPLQMNIVKLYSITDDFFEGLNDPFLQESYRDHFDFGSGASIYFTTDASYSPKKSYFYSRLQLDLAGNSLRLLLPKKKVEDRINIWGMPFSQYVRGEITNVYTKRFGRDNKQSFATRLLLGMGKAYGNSTALPFEKLFYAGGSNSMRAWQARSIGPGSAPVDTTFSIPNQTGDLKLELNFEYRFPLGGNFYGAAFVDAGNVWRYGKIVMEENIEFNYKTDPSIFRFKDFYKSTAVNWGLGIRLDIEFVILRLDWGIKLYDPLYQKFQPPYKWIRSGGSAIQFGIGLPF